MYKRYRLWALCLSLLLCLSAVPALGAEVGDEVDMQNPGFEEATETGNPGWVYMDGANITVDTSRARTGKNSLKINNDKDNNPWATQIVAGLVPGAMYELGAWLNTDLVNPDGNGVGFKIEQYDEAGDYINGYDPSGTKLKMNTLGQWNYHSIIFQTAPNVHTIKTYLRSYTPGIVWYDDVTLKLSGGPEPYSFYADHVFHYPDEETGTAYVRLDSYYAADSEEATSVSAAFTFLDGDKVLDKKENVKITDGAAKYTYPVSMMQEKKKQYVLAVELRDQKGEVIRTWQQNMYVYDRPKYMPENGVCFIDGKCFDPIIAYHASHATSYEAIREGGFTAVQTGSGAAVNREQLDNTMAKLGETGLKAVFCLYPGMKPAGHPDNIEKTKEIVEEFKDDSRIFAWAVMDEPMGAGVTDERKKWLEDSYRAIRDIDDNHPVYVLDYNNHAETIKYCDVFVADVYIHPADASSVSRVIEPLTKNHPRVSTYELAAAFQWNGKFPSVTAMRASVYRGFEAGGSYGTGFYSIDDAIGHDAGDEKTPLYKLDVWQDITTLIKEETPILFDYYAGDGITSFNKERKGEAYRELLWETWFTADGSMYLLAHNRSAAAADFDIPLVSTNGKIRVGSYKAEPVGLTATGEKTGDGSISFTLGQEEVALYKIIPAEKVDLSQIDAPSFDDISGDYAWAKDAIVEMQGRGVINEKGKGVFAPGEAITRGDLAGFLIRTLGFTSDSAENFADVPAEREYAKEMAAGKALGILQGVGDNLFSPEAPITRQDMMTICARGMKMAEKLAPADSAALDAFHDKENVADYAFDSVAAMIASGIIQGDDAGYLNPTGNTRRAEAAVIMQRILGAKKVDTAAEAQETPKVENEIIEFAAPSEAAQAKYSRAAALLKGLGAPEIKTEASITNGEAEAVLSAILGYAYDGFGENHLALKTQSAVKGFVDLLGYAPYIARDGGYTGTAARIELTKGVDVSGEYLRGGDFALMLENALGISLTDPAAYGENTDETYVETDDTLLTRYCHLQHVTGALTENENTSLPRGQVKIGETVYKAGKTDAASMIGKRVDAYVTQDGEDTILYIRAAKNTEEITVGAAKIVRGETTKTLFVWEGDSRTLSESITGARILVNGKYVQNPSADTVTPQAGTVTLYKHGGKVETVSVSSYINLIVDKVVADRHDDSVHTLYFKNHDAIVWNTSDKNLRYTSEGDIASLKKWNVLSLYESEDRTVRHAVVSQKTVKGTATEISDRDITVSGSTYKKADDFYGAAEVGEVYTFLLNHAEEIVGVNTDAEVKNYAYLTSIAQKKGVDAVVEMRVLTKEGDMKVMPLKDKVRLNGTQVNSEELLTSPLLFADGKTKDQLIVLETAGDTVTGFETAQSGEGMPDAQRYNTFTRDFETGTAVDKSKYDGYASRVLASKYIVDEKIVLFVVPEETSDNPADYSVRGASAFVHDKKYYNATLYDIDENMYIGAVVQKIENVTDIGDSGTTGVVIRVGKALGDDGEVVQTVTVMRDKETTLKFQSDDFRIVLNGKTLTNLSGGETEYTENLMGVKKLNEYMYPAALNVGDVVLYTLKGGTNDVIAGMRVLLRGKSPLTGEKSAEGTGEFYNYSWLTYAYGMVQRTVERGFLMTPAGYERLFWFEGNGAEAPVLLVEDGKVERVDPREIQRGDKVFVQKVNPYTTIMVIYR